MVEKVFEHAMWANFVIPKSLLTIGQIAIIKEHMFDGKLVNKSFVYDFDYTLSVNKDYV